MGLPKNFEYPLYHKYKSGEKNLISDVPGVSVGHTTLISSEENIHTGVTAVLPHQGNLFLDKVLAAAEVINGFGKTAGLIQVQELGTIETPIILTNTLSVGTALTACVKHALKQNPDIGVSTGTVNGLVTECNDGRINDIRGLHIKEEHVLTAMEAAKISNAGSRDFAEGAVGAGAGMVCLGLKGGIGSASRILTVDGRQYHIGSLVLTNFGAAGNLVIGGQHIDTRLAREYIKKAGIPGPAGTSEPAETPKDTGSIIILLATDIPLNERQLKRTAKRSSIALGRTGSYCGNGSGDIAIAFTTANRVPHYSSRNILPQQMFFDENIDMVFEAAVEATEEAILSSLWHAETTTGINGRTYMGLQDFLVQHSRCSR